MFRQSVIARSPPQSDDEAIFWKTWEIASLRSQWPLKDSLSQSEHIFDSHYKWSLNVFGLWMTFAMREKHTGKYEKMGRLSKRLPIDKKRDYRLPVEHFIQVFIFDLERNIVRRQFFFFKVIG